MQRVVISDYPNGKRAWCFVLYSTFISFKYNGSKTRGYTHSNLYINYHIPDKTLYSKKLLIKFIHITQLFYISKGVGEAKFMYNKFMYNLQKKNVFKYLFIRYLDSITQAL
jgi:hypothetical protein